MSTLFLKKSKLFYKNVEKDKQSVYNFLDGGKTMTTLKERLRIALSNKNMKQSVLAYRIGVDRSYISNYLSGKYEPSYEILQKMADVLGVSMSWLKGVDSNKNEETSSKSVKIPVLGYVAAGIPIEAITDILDYEELDSSMIKDGSEYFALKIKGDSMEPKISNGDVVIVRKQENCDSGQIAIVCVNGDQATCKKIVKQSSGIMLVPLNTAYETVFYSNEDILEIPITILGRVVELRAKF